MHVSQKLQCPGREDFRPSINKSFHAQGIAEARHVNHAENDAGVRARFNLTVML
jgi:hypothetical protein